VNAAILIALMAIVTYCTRLAGFAFRGRRLPDGIERFLACVPVAAFAALLATGLSPGDSGADARALAAVPAALIALRWRKLWLTLASGMVFYWISMLIL
jgi:branched-subunit amino acid transport protein